MKKIIKISTVCCLVAFLAASCVDMDLAPTDQISSGSMWTTEELADNGMKGLYAPFYPSQLSSTQLSRSDGLNRQGIEAMGFPTDYYSNNYPVGLLSNSMKRANDWQVGHEWKFGYTIVHACNDAIANLHKAGLSEEKFERYQCEARFIRAWAYHRLNMLYQGVPIYLEPVDNQNATKLESTPEQVWDVVLEDLTYCIENEYLANNTLTSNYGRPSKGAAYALRGMVYMWKEMYKEAASDFEQVGKCGYGLWDGEYVEFFKPENEKNKEMIFSLQYDESIGYSDNIQQMTGSRDTYDGWTEIKPSADFVDYYTNADGSKFNWSEVPGLEDWDLLTPKQREVFFCRDGLFTESTLRNAVIGRVGQEVFDTYYLNEGNEARIKQAYENRDPRLQQTIVTPYVPLNAFFNNNIGNENHIGKQARWPLKDRGKHGGDYWIDKRTSAFYSYRKYVEFEKGRLISRSQCHTDWPLIRYTDVVLQYAEALAQQDKIAEALAEVNKVRRRAGIVELVQGGSAGNSVNGKEEMLERIRYERRVEFCVEGINFFDEVRWGTYKESKFQGMDVNGGKSWWGDMVEYKWYYTETMWPWSIPLNQVQMNPDLQKRPDWAY